MDWSPFAKLWFLWSRDKVIKDVNKEDKGINLVKESKREVEKGDRKIDVKEKSKNNENGIKKNNEWMRIDKEVKSKV